MLLGSIYTSAEMYAALPAGLRFALLGDSMTWIGGEDCCNPTGWSHMLKSSGIADEIEVYARSGATWTNTAFTRTDTGFYSEVLHDDNVVYNQALRLIEHSDSSATVPDVIILFAGANDAWFALRRPDIYKKSEYDKRFTTSTFPSEVTSLFGSVALTCDVLKERFPNSELVLVTPLQMSKTDEDTIIKVADIIEDAGRRRECMVIRADKESGITHDEESRKPKYTYDGVHTNPDGARLLGELIVKALKTDNSQLKNDN